MPNNKVKTELQQKLSNKRKSMQELRNNKQDKQHVLTQYVQDNYQKELDDKDRMKLMNVINQLIFNMPSDKAEQLANEIEALEAKRNQVDSV